MLGSLDRGRLLAILGTLARGDAPALMAELRTLGELAPDYDQVLGSLAGLLQLLAVIQVAGSQALEADDDLPELQRLAAGLDPGVVQLMYQIAVMGRRDLPLAPDPRVGFEMALLRVLAFEPQAPERQLAPATGVAAAAPPPRSAVTAPAPAAPGPAGPNGAIADWPAFVATLQLDGAARQLAANSALAGQVQGELRLCLEARNRHLLTESLKARLAAAVSERLGGPHKLNFSVQDQAPDTAARRQARDESADLERARETLAADSNVAGLQELLGARIVPDSVRRAPETPAKKPTTRK
jgi:DNA polymerase-3 subunit gamma/tau